MSNKTYDNSGTLGKNERKEKETHPTHTGRCTIDGKEYWISAWIREGDRGKFFSLAFKPKEQKSEPRREQVPGPKSDEPFEEFNDDLPF